MEIKVERIYKLDDKQLNRITKWMHEWWGIEESYCYDEVRCMMAHSMQEGDLPQTYVAKVNDEIVGMFQLMYQDLSCRPDLYPWLCNVYVDKAYRHQGVLKCMMNQLKDICLPYPYLYLYTTHKGLYESFGFEFVEEIETYLDPHYQRLYRYKIKN